MKLRAGTLGALLMAVGATPEATAGAGAAGVEVVLLANAGVLLRGGGSAALVDGCVREPYSIYGAVPDDVWRRLLAAEPPFERLDVVLVSHAHRDHFQVAAARELLLARREAVWVVHREVADLLADGWSQWPGVAERVAQVAPPEGRAATWKRDGLEVEIVRLPHNPARTTPENLAHVIRIGGRTVVHVGDADARPEHLRAAGLAGRTFDVALLPYWYWQDERFAAALRTLSGHRGNVALHVPPGESPRPADSALRSPTLLRQALDAVSF